MTLQIDSIFLYNTSGDIRSLKFNIGSVNIISGRSNTGKSAIIPIIEYCLGVSDFAIPGEVIRQNVEYYAVSYKIGDDSAFIAKRKPSNGSRKQSQAYYAENLSETPPPKKEIEPNTNDAEIRRNLSKLMGSKLHTEGDSTSLAISLPNTYFYLFQKSTVIAHDSLLFHRQEIDSGIIRDTLPHFLGILRDEDIRLKNQLEESRLNLRRLRDKISQERRNLDEMLIKGRELLLDAQALSLLDLTVEPSSLENVHRIKALLKNLISSWEPEKTSFVPDNRIIELKRELDLLEQEYIQLYAEYRSAENLQREASGYTEYVEQQRLRLHSINLISYQNPLDFAESSDVCPLCMSDFSDKDINVAKISSIRSALLKLENNLSAVELEQPVLSEFIHNTHNKLEQQKRIIDNKKLEIDLVMREQSSAKNIADEIYEANSRVDRLIGGIEYYLKIATTDSSEMLEDQRQAEQKRYDELSEEIESRKSEDTERRVLDTISTYMTEWSKKLDISYSGKFFLDIQRLTVTVDEANRSISMQEMGGSANYLGCHLMTLLSLHRFFIEQMQPVPNFIVLDQPAQIYFPSQNTRDVTFSASENTPVNDDDLVAVQELFDFLFDVCDSLNGKMQIIILEHAHLDSEKFSNAIIDDASWFDTDGLIPSEWINAPPKPQTQMNMF